MKKLGLLVSTMLLSTQVFAAATLRIPVMIVDDNTNTITPVATLNLKLAASGFKTLPEYVTISTSDDGYKKIQNVEDQLAKAVTALGGDPEVIRLEGGDVPTGADTKQNYTCYTGNPLEIPDVIGKLTDVLYTEQLTMHVLKYKKTTKAIYDQVDLEDNEDFFNESEIWKNWQGQNDDLLILSSTNDSGDDIQESLIKRCK
ncbi:hypothetical protein [Bdellovibrio sp. HCB337]|uniref:hypothetical protein n=1 Tax=Bdellovibrio sp. HCB337 TaxID=3394358 RepID=UPI0039A4B9D8